MENPNEPHKPHRAAPSSKKQQSPASDQQAHAADDTTASDPAHHLAPASPDPFPAAPAPAQTRITTPTPPPPQDLHCYEVLSLAVHRDTDAATTSSLPQSECPGGNELIFKLDLMRCVVAAPGMWYTCHHFAWMVHVRVDELIENSRRNLAEHYGRVPRRTWPPGGEADEDMGATELRHQLMEEYWDDQA